MNKKTILLDQKEIFLKKEKTIAIDLLELIKNKTSSNVNFYYHQNMNEQLELIFDESTKVEHKKIKELLKELKAQNIALKEGDFLGKCKIIKAVGKGLTSDVYKAFHQFLGIEVALKVLSNELKEENSLIEEMFLQEAKNTAKLRHENLVRIFDAEKGEKYTYMVMEFIDGIDLSFVLDSGKTLKSIQAVEVMIQLCDVLDYALKKGFIHRDIKPANIMISKSLEVKLMDLGLSKVQETASKESDHMVGTPFYMSPEQFINSEAVDYRSDLYSLGATFFHLITGKPPFRGTTLSEIIQEKIIKEFDLKIEAPEVPEELKSVLYALLNKNPDKRIQKYSDLRILLDEIRKKYK